MAKNILLTEYRHTPDTPHRERLCIEIDDDDWMRVLQVREIEAGRWEWEISFASSGNEINYRERLVRMFHRSNEGVRALCIENSWVRNKHRVDPAHGAIMSTVQHVRGWNGDTNPWPIQCREVPYGIDRYDFSVNTLDTRNIRTEDKEFYGESILEPSTIIFKFEVLCHAEIVEYKFSMNPNLHKVDF